jgi:hypothetical protein
MKFGAGGSLMSEEYRAESRNRRLLSPPMSGGELKTLRELVYDHGASVSLENDEAVRLLQAVPAAPTVAPGAPGYEEELVRRQVVLDEEQKEIHLEMEAHFLPLVRTELSKETPDIPAARAVLRRMPDCVAKVFGMDAVRQAENLQELKRHLDLLPPIEALRGGGPKE